MFFQISLFLGYLYAHLLHKVLKPRSGWMVHCAIIALAAISLLVPQEQVARSATGELSWDVTRRLISMIALPFVVLSATSPLIQAWHSMTHPAQQTYRLYALSNAGSLLALLSYPIVFDPLIGIATQSVIWTTAFVLFAMLMVACGWQIASADSWPAVTCRTNDQRGEKNIAVMSCYSPFTWLTWVVLAANGSVLLISASNILCQELASFPFLWLLPLICYLLTLIICFDSPYLYRQWFFLPLFAASCFVAIIVYHFGINTGLISLSIGFCMVIFSGCMICHGELVRTRPDVTRLTQFYLAVAGGGALGGILAVAVAPRIFSRFFEFHFALLLVVAFSTVSIGVKHFRRSKSSGWQIYLMLLVNGFAAVPVLSSLYYHQDPGLNPGILFQGRNDYGLISVKQTQTYRIMQSGSTNHGGQFLATQRQHQPFAYYGPGSGAERAFSIVRSRGEDANQSLHIGIIGLGTGSLLSHGQPGDQFRFYEINPMVVQVAHDYFTYLPSENAAVVLGDGRIELQREWDEGGSNQFDLLFLDAFSSDSIPIHLLTYECFDLYLRHLNSDGIIVAHITNKFIDLKPVLASLARLHQLDSAWIEHREDAFAINTNWILLSPDFNLLDNAGLASRQLQWTIGLDELVWTDDNSSVFPIVNWTTRGKE